MINIESLIPEGFSVSHQYVDNLGDVISITNLSSGKIIDVNFSASDQKLNLEDLNDRLIKPILGNLR